MGQRKVKLQFGYKHIKKTHRKRPGRHAKCYSKRIPRRKRSRGQGK
jgi:hypothetical protein